MPTRPGLPTTPLDVGQLVDLGDTVCVWAHPDDETYLCGGIMAALRHAGHRVVCVTATRGERGGQAAPDALAEVRTRELEQALATLGVIEHHWLGIDDGACDRTPAEGPVSAITRILDAVRPRTVLTFAADGMTGHPDHRAVGAWTDEAFARAALPDAQLLHAATTAADLAASADVDRLLGIYVGSPPDPTPSPLLAVRATFSGRLLAQKLAALEQLESQTSAVRDALGEARYGTWVKTETFRLPAVPVPAARDPRASRRVEPASAKRRQNRETR